MMKASGRLAVIAALLVGSILVIGGCHDPAAARATARRWEQAHRPIELYKAREARSPVQLACIVDRARRAEKRHVQNSARDRQRLREWARRDVERWNADQPARRERIADHLDGDPAKIPGTLVAMFY